MEWALASLAVALLAYAAVSGRITGTSLTAPMVFTAFGLLVGSEALGFIDLSPLSDSVQELAEATLAVVLFADASRIDLRALRGELGIPARLLGVGLPLTLAAGFAVALALLGELAWPEALLLAVILAPTDAALGQAVVTLPRLPVRVRQSLNVESGLNDGICVPVFLIVLAIATAEGGAIGDGAAARLVGEQIGYGALAGVIAGAVSAAAILVAERATPHRAMPGCRSSLSPRRASPGGSPLRSEAPVSSAPSSAGDVPGAATRHGGDVAHLVDEAGDVLGAVTFVVFGAVLLGPALERADGVDRPVRAPQPDRDPHGAGRARPASARACARRPSASSAGSGRAAWRRSCSR